MKDFKYKKFKRHKIICNMKDYKNSININCIKLK